MKVTKSSNKSQLKNMKTMLKQILGPSENNKHIYLDKIFSIEEAIGKYDQFYQKIMQQFLNKKQITSLLNETDEKFIKQICDMRSSIQEEFKTDQQPNVQINVLHLLKSQKVQQFSAEEITSISDYTNGLVENSVLQKIIAFMSNCQKNYSRVYCTESVQDCTLIELQQTFKEATELMQSLPIYDHDIWQFVSDARFGDDYETLKRVAVLINILTQKAQKIHEIMVRPEIDVLKMKEIIEKAIQEFKKQVNGCDTAFNKLMKSLDIFVQKFDKYYEKFLTENKDPMVFFFEFIEDVKSQYQDTSKSHCREILRQFKDIQVKFGEKIAQGSNNSGIKNLYAQLCEQMEKASTIIATEE